MQRAGLKRRARVAFDVLRAEGWAGALARAREHAQEWWARPSARVTRELQAPVLNVLPTPPSPRLGGIAVQFRARIAVEAQERVVALLYPVGGGFRLEVKEGRRQQALDIALPYAGDRPDDLTDTGWEAAVQRSVEATGARAIHFETALPALASMVALAGRGWPLILSLHDFSLFGRPHPTTGHGRPESSDEGGRRRALAAELLSACAAVVFPSRFLSDQHRELLGRGRQPAERVIAPSSAAVSVAAAPRAAASLRHVAWVGAVHEHKGAGVFEEVLDSLPPSGAGGLRWSVFGGGEPHLLRRLRARGGVAVRGYYRAGALPGLLRAGEVDLALILSITPEAYGLVADECLRAGTPVLAFDHGAVGERLGRVGGAILVPPAEGATGVVRALRALIAGAPLPLVSRETASALPSAESAATEHLALYRDLRLL